MSRATTEWRSPWFCRSIEVVATRSNAAIRAEPRGIGTSTARDPLAREVKLLGALLGQVIVEQEGADALDLVERVRRATIRLRRGASAGRLSASR